MAGRDITASPSQLVARTSTFELEEGLKVTKSKDSKWNQQVCSGPAGNMLRLDTGRPGSTLMKSCAWRKGKPPNILFAGSLFLCKNSPFMRP